MNVRIQVLKIRKWLALKINILPNWLHTRIFYDEELFDLIEKGILNINKYIFSPIY